MAATKLSLYQQALRNLGDVRLAALTDDIEARFALDDAYAGAIEFVLRQAPWRFALKTAALVASTGPVSGYSSVFALPADWLRTHALFVINAAGIDRPFALVEQGRKISANIAAPQIRYISSDYADPALAGNPWPEHFAECVAAYLSFLVAERVTGERSAPGRMSQLFSSLLPAAITMDAIAEDPWLSYQRDGSFLRAAHAVIGRGYWRFALKTIQVDGSEQQDEPAVPGLPYRFALPDDLLRTHALFVPFDGDEMSFNIRETVEGWSTDTPVFAARYITTAALDATIWPEIVAKAVLAYLDWQMEPTSEETDKAAKVRAPTFDSLIAEAMAEHSLREHQWLRFQLDGRYQQAVKLVLEQARWRFAVKTVVLADSADPTSLSEGAVSPGYSFRFIRPPDWLRTLRLYFSQGDGVNPLWYDIDYRDELDAFHANYSPLVLRYVSRNGLDATQWPPNFREAVLSWLEYGEVRDEPKMASVAGAKLALYRAQLKNAETLDDERDMPRVNNLGRFIQARYGARARGPQGIPGVSSTTILTSDNLTDEGGEVLTAG